MWQISPLSHSVGPEGRGEISNFETLKIHNLFDLAKLFKVLIYIRPLERTTEETESLPSPLSIPRT